jgi:hypothetical protein
MIRRESVRVSLSILVVALTGCATFRAELPEVLYVVNLNEMASSTGCEALAQQFAQQTPLRVDQQRSSPTRPAPAPNYCEVGMKEADGNHDNVLLSWTGIEIRLLLHHRSAWGFSSTPNEGTTRLATLLVSIIKLRYPAAEARQEKVYSNPLFD